MMDEQNEKKSKKKLGGMKKILAVMIVLAVLAGIVLLAGRFRQDEKKEIMTKSRLEEVIHVSELSTFEAVYNGITEVANKENPENIDYYVYYEAKVKAGIDFEKVEVNVDNEEKKISVTIPEIKINDVNVDIASLDYIFENEKANTETVSQEAYKAAIADVTNESANEPAIYELAEQNARNIVEALLSPFIKQFDAEYSLEINQEEKQ
ncbi:MAG: DUF4230 domain-containing protein [Bacteroidales bacterium]|nr:DUF4230 domain-containing protein [Clostridium sp.]MCM1205025.1 DUF4230 domain-containing protein [Bacteroidales bacterium]